MTLAPQEFSLSFLDETADAFFRVFRGLQPALLLLQLSRRHVRPFKCGFPRIGEGRCDRERGLFADHRFTSICAKRQSDAATTMSDGPGRQTPKV
jgi:hypothetical protein